MTNGSFGCESGMTERFPLGSSSGRKAPGHYGLDGMRERAGLMGGSSPSWSELDSGTGKLNEHSAFTALRDTSASRRSWPFRKKTEVKS